MLQQLDNYDWEEVFGEGCGGNCTPIKPEKFFSDYVSTDTFSREDVSELKGQCDGENDGEDWIVWGILRDGRYFLAYGGCDYTGWDCRASNGGTVASSEDILIRYRMTKEQRERFGVALPDD